MSTGPRSDAQAASGDQAPTASGDREQDLPDWLQPSTEGLVEGESLSSGSVGETIPKTLVAHVPARPSNNWEERHIFFLSPKDTTCAMLQTVKITRAPCRRNRERREGRIPQAAKLENKLSADLS